MSAAIGASSWVAFTFALVARVNKIPFSASGGLVHQGLISRPRHDLTALGVYYGKFSERLPNQNAETVVEANYCLQRTPWIYDIDDAAVFSGAISIDS